MIFTSRLLKKYLLFFVLILCNQIFAMQKSLVKNIEQQYEHSKENIKIPLTVPQFKQKTILLPDNQEDSYPLSFDLSKESCITHYQLGGKPVARLLQMGDSFHFQGDSDKQCNFLLQNQLKAELLAIATKGKFTFQKPVETSSTSLSCNAVEFFDKFSSKNGLSIDADYCDDFGQVSCKEMVFKGNQFNIMTDSSLTAQNMAALLLKKGFFNDGKISCAGKVFVTAPSIENWGSLVLNNLGFESNTFLNEGDIDIQSLLHGSCESFNHHGHLNVHNDCIFEKIGTLSVSETATWDVEKNWKAYIDRFYLEGNATAGILALLSIGIHAKFDGSLRAPIIHIDSNDLITCNSTAELIASHYVGLKAKGWLQFEGDIFKKFLQKNEQSSNDQKLGDLLKNFPRGIFLTSVQSGIKKSGSIIAKTGTVSLDAKKNLIHSGLTQAGFDPQAALLINATSLKLEKDSLLNALNARLTAQASLDQLGKAQIQELLTMEASAIQHHGFSKAGTLCAKGNNITMSASSRIDVENGAFEVKEKIAHAGSLAATQQFVMNAHDIVLDKTSNIDIVNAELKAKETISNQGHLSASQLLERAKYVENSGTIKADQAHIKADRRWWNKWAGIVNVKNNLTIDALTSFNTFGAIQAQDLTINAGIDCNFLGLYRAKNTHINALIGLNAGILLPKFDSLNDLLSRDNAKKVGWHLFTKFVPQVGVLFSIKNNVENIYNQGGALFAQAQHLYGNEDTGASDVIALLCGIKNVALSAYQTKDMGYQVYDMAQHGYQMAQQTYKTMCSDDFKMPSLSETGSYVTSEISSNFSSINWNDASRAASDAASDIVGILGSQVNKDTLFDLNCGGMIGINGQSHSLCNTNYGLSGFVNKNSINTYSGINKGVMGAGVLNVNAKEAYKSTGAIGAIKASLDAHDLDVAGKVRVLDKAAFKVEEKVTIDANINSNKFDIHAKTAELKKGAQCIARGGDANVVAHNITSDATVQGQHVRYIGSESVTLGNDSKVTSAKKTIVVSKDTNIGGKINAAGKAYVKADNKAIIDADISGKQTIVEAKDAELKKDSKLAAREGLALVRGESVTSDAKIDGKQVQLVGNQSLKLGKNSDITSAQETILLADDANVGGKINAGGKAYIKSNKVVVEANINGNKEAIIDAKSAELKEGSSLLSKEGLAAVAADQINNKGFIQGKQAQLLGKQITLGEGSHVSSHGDADNTFVKATEHLTLQKGSTIEGDIVGIDAKTVQGEDGNIIRSKNGGHLKTEHLDNHGTIHGNMALQFDGIANDLKSIGNVEHLQYQGTLADDLADKFAQGNNKLLHVEKGGSITLIADEQDVRFKEKHNLQHTLRAKTDGSIFCDQAMTTQESFVFDAKKDVHHKTLKAGKLNYMKAGEKLVDTAKVKRVLNGANYEDDFDRSEVTGYQVYMEAGKEAHHFGTKVHSGLGGTTVIVDGKLVSKAARCEEYKEEVHAPHKTGKKTIESEITQDLDVHHVVTEYTSDGVVNVCAKEGEFDASVIGGELGRNVYIQQKPQFNKVRDYHKHHKGHTKDVSIFTDRVDSNDFFGSYERVMHFKGKAVATVQSDEAIDISFTSDASKIILKAPKVTCSLGENYEIESSTYDKGYWFVKSHKEHEKYDAAYTPVFKGTIETDAEEFHCDTVNGHKPEIKSLTGKTKVYYRELFEEHTNESKARLRPTKMAINIVAAAACIITSILSGVAGAGIATLCTKNAVTSLIISQFTAGGLSSISTQLISTFAACEGDIEKTKHELAKNKTLQKAVLAALASVATAGASQAINATGLPTVHQAKNLAQRLAYTAPRQAVNAGIKIVTDIASGNDAKDAAIHNLKLAAAGTIGVASSSQIGHMYTNKQIDPVTHKVLHTGVGAVEGLIINGPQGAAAGALGAGIAETVADICKPNPLSIVSIKELERKYGRQLTQAEFTQEWNKKCADYKRNTATVAEISRFAATSVALVTKQDIAIANNTASTAIDNNFLILAAYGVAAAGIAYTAYDIYCTYQNDGTEAALKHLGIEVLTTAVTAGAVRYGGLALFKVGKKAYPTAEAAIKAALKHSPGLQIALDSMTNFTKDLALNANKLLNNKVGRKAIRLHEQVAKIEQKLVSTENKIIEKISRQFANGCDDLVNCTVPGSALSKVEQEICKQNSKKLIPLGRGSTAKAAAQTRNEPKDLQEQLLMEEIMADPSKGFDIGIKKGMTDPRWHQDDGWIKKGWKNENMRWEVDKEIWKKEKRSHVQVHYVAQEIDGIIKAVDDFKIKDYNMKTPENKK